MVQSLHSDRLSRSPRTPSTWSSSTSSTTPRPDLRPAAQPPAAARASGSDRDARAPRRPGRDRVVRAANRGRAAPVGGHRPGLPRAVPVLRRRGRNRSAASSRGGEVATRRRAQQPPHPTTTSASRSCSRPIQRIVLDPGTCARSGSASRRSTPTTWPASSPRRAAKASRSRATTRRTSARSDSTNSRRVAAMHFLRRGPRRGRRRAGRGLLAPAAADRVGDALHAAARSRPPAGRGQEPPDGHRPDRSASARVPLRGPAEGDRRPSPRAGPRPGQERLPVPAGRVHGRSRPSEPRDRHRQPAGCGTALALENVVADLRPRLERPRLSSTSSSAMPPARGHLSASQLD